MFYGFYVGPAKLQRGASPPSVMVLFVYETLVISVLISLDQELSENVWFVWSEASYSGDKWIYVAMRDGRTDEQLKIELLSL